MTQLKREYVVPGTAAVLKPFIVLKMMTYDGTKSFDDSQILSLSAGLVEVGTIKKFTFTNTRKGGGYYRTFNSGAPGTIDETYPGLAEYELSLDTVVLHKGSLLEVLGYGAADIGYNDSPLIVQIQRLTPNNISPRTWIFKSCWMQDNPYDFDAMPGDLLLTQSMKLSCGGVIEGSSDQG